uniref:BON domain-containing protein n=1 Tax=Schlesneria paludicola TaxID=360056 RepID=A0A7C4QLY8_9PLAN
MVLSRCWTRGWLLGLACLLLTNQALAQGFFNTVPGDGGMSGGTPTGGSSMFNSGGAGSSGSSFATSSFNTTSMSGGGGMATGQTGMTGQTGRNTGGVNAQGANGFLGANNNPNNFLGRNTQGQQAVTTTNQNRQNFRGGQQRGLDQSLLNLLNGGAQNAGNTNNRTNTIRPRQKVNFEHPTLQTSVVVNDVKVRFEKLATRYPQLKQIELIPGEGGIVILRGEVASEGDSKLAESLVRLEPGVKSIQNELTFPTPYSAE